MHKIIPVLFLSASLTGFSQLTLVKSLEMSIQGVYTDQLSNFYVLSDNVFIKYSLDGKKICSYFPKNGEQITYADTRNPFKIMIVFGNKNTVLFLDKDLNEVSDEITFNELEIFGKSLICYADMGGFYLWDEDKSELLKLNIEFEVEYSRMFKISGSVAQIYNTNDLLLFRTEKGTLLLYDFSDNQFQLLTETTRQSVFLYEGGFAYFDERRKTFKTLLGKDFKFKELNYKFPPESTVKDAVILNRTICAYDERKLKFFE